jgi:hypothetical protein
MTKKVVGVFVRFSSACQTGKYFSPTASTLSNEEVKLNNVLGKKTFQTGKVRSANLYGGLPSLGHLE